MEIQRSRYLKFLPLILFGGAFSSVCGAKAAENPPVLMVISNQDFWYQDYADTRASIEAQGLEVVVAAATTEVAVPHKSNSSKSDDADRGFVTPDLALTDVNAEDYSAIVFSGGWGMAQYQYGFEGTYHNSNYYPDPIVTAQVNQLIGDFTHQEKYVAAICNGVSVLAWARIDGVSPIEGRNVVSWAGGGPGFELDWEDYADSTVSTRWHIESNGGYMPLSAAVGDPVTSEDDVVVDGNIITAENYESAALFGAVIAQAVLNGSPRQQINQINAYIDGSQ